MQDEKPERHATLTCTCDRCFQSRRANDVPLRDDVICTSTLAQRRSRPPEELNIMKNKPLKRKTINRDELCKLAYVNSNRLPTLIECDGQRLRWVGIGWVDEGELDGTETLVIDKE